MDGERTAERVEAMLRPFENSDSATEHVSVKLSLAEFKSLANAALLALRQQDGMVRYERAPALDRRIAHGDDFSGDAWVRWTAVGQRPNAASGQDQRGAAAQGLPAVKSASLPASDSLSPGLRSGEPVLFSSGISDSAQQPAQSAPHPSTDLLRGIKLGLEAAAKVCEDRACDWDSAVRNGSEVDCYETTVLMESAGIIRKLNPAAIAAAAEKGK